MGVPIASGPLDASTRERASATPAHTAEGHRTGSAFRERAPKGPARTASNAPPLAAPLRALQDWFAAAVMHPVGVLESVRERGAVGSQPVGVEDAERVVAPSSRLSGLDRVAIYHDAFRARLVECLADDYPALRHALGQSPFETLCHAYITKHPSRSPNLNSFGRRMSDFCRSRNEPLAAFSADLAALEWAMVDVVHAAPADGLSEAALATIPPTDWPRARFEPSDIVRVLEFGYPVNAYFQAYNTEGDPSVPEPAWSANAVFRDGPTIWRMDLSPAMHALLDALFGGRALGGALEALASSGQLTEEEAPSVMQWFRDWVRYGFFAKIFIEPEER